MAKIQVKCGNCNVIMKKDCEVELVLKNKVDKREYANDTQEEIYKKVYKSIHTASRYTCPTCGRHQIADIIDKPKLTVEDSDFIKRIEEIKNDPKTEYVYG